MFVSEVAIGRPGRYLAVPALAIALMVAVSLSAQQRPAVAVPGSSSSPTAPVTFRGYDVVSVKPNRDGGNNMSWRTDDTMLQGSNITIKMLLSNAYGIRAELISGLPAWATNDHWNIQAKVLDNEASTKDRKLTREQEEALFREKVIWVLKDRFQLKAHTEVKEQPVYDLVVSKSGSKLKPHDAASGDEGIFRNSGMFKATDIRMPDLARNIEFDAGRNVIDKTGLTGSYDFELKWSEDANNVNAADNGSSDRLPDFFTALQEELGLKLVPAKGAVTSLVVDSIEQPTAD